MKKMYKSITYLTVLLSMLVGNFNAQIFSVVGNGTIYNGTTGWPAPYGNFWWGSKHQMFVSAADLTTAGVAGGAQISSIGFNIYSTNSAANHQGWTVKVYTTGSNDPLASGWVSTGQVAASTPVTAAGVVGWNQNSFTPFIWNGSDNLVIETCFNNSSYTSNYSTYYTSGLSGSSIKTRYRYADNPTNCTDPSTYADASNRPNMRFEWISPTPCTTAPGANSVVTPTFQICPNSTAYLGLATSYTIGGLTYSWQSSTISPVGPFTPVPGGNSPGLTTPNLTVSTYYQAVITCTNTAGTTTTSAGQVTVSPVITSTIPYYEGFEGIGVANKLPNCSWAASNMPITCQTYISSNTNGRIARTGSSFASFYYNPAGNNYFYTNGIQLNAGVTYSASLWYTTEYYGYNNWTDLSIMYGTTQSPTGLVTIASTNGPAISNVYKSLSNTFSVPTSGLYYVAIKAAGTTGSSAQYLSWDDLEIIIPCTPTSPNTPSISLVTTTTTICAGETVNLSVSGADTYTWNTGSNASSLSETPQNTQLYTVIGTNLLSGCTNTVNQTIIVNERPSVIVVANPVTVCSGAAAVLQAIGGTTYTWSSGGNGQNITVNPTTPTSYTALSMGANGCIGSAAVSIGINPLPNVTAATDRPSQMCPTEIAVLSAVGSGTSYQWISNTSSALLMGNPINVSPSSTSIFTVTATDANGCENSATVVQTVADCTGLTEGTILSNLNVFPNPTAGEFSIETTNTLTKSIEVIDIAGKVVYTTTSNLDVVKFNLKDVANGVYYVKIQSNNSIEVVKVVKQ